MGGFECNCVMCPVYVMTSYLSIKTEAEKGINKDAEGGGPGRKQGGHLGETID